MKTLWTKHSFAELRDKTLIAKSQGKTPNTQPAFRSTYATGIILVLFGINNVAQE